MKQDTVDVREYETMAAIRALTPDAYETYLKERAVATVDGKQCSDEWRECPAFLCGTPAEQAKRDMVAADTSITSLLGKNVAAVMVDGDCALYVRLQLEKACKEKLLLLEMTSDTWEQLFGTTITLSGTTDDQK
ncbi:hypothetical protein TGPRC2_264620 [Toxoplasma gondii TgCatPRC2]|uniref:Uncharacterized protein n=3 Tax=Toxoplasma gondii TaxID=5811 RepID=A0A151H623_TOXGO|nr:hypothetical protein TGME49_264620 [Toxoplasma gondii ME49]EPT27801.1 hypothetical protein TGME49_264620 [Toxoplasma gondii ME49]KYF45325.1 hypothetical protein TGARI_264620 [Toxoplasma gondii ARI]KYK64799.1 hypothetical protein TGPRC2_264620 [Toxoplasma gondii TgCatPRC2]|eukprot:XP_018636331.1 hypothetical protein TGME49_264620 [Toxoplasma gondii ME49]